MKYFNGFSLQGEEIFFHDKLIQSDVAVAGFSYGAQQALEYVYANPLVRVDRLILLSPAFFQHHKKSFMRTQLRYYRSDPDAYEATFLQNVAYPSDQSLTAYLKRGSEAELSSLLHYVWDRDKLQSLQDRGVIIEVFIGQEDKIVDAQESFAFFSSLATTYLIKGVGHLLV